MKASTPNEPLTEAESTASEKFLKSCKGSGRTWTVDADARGKPNSSQSDLRLAITKSSGRSIPRGKSLAMLSHSASSGSRQTGLPARRYQYAALS